MNNVACFRTFKGATSSNERNNKLKGMESFKTAQSGKQVEFPALMPIDGSSFSKLHPTLPYPELGEYSAHSHTLRPSGTF